MSKFVLTLDSSQITSFFECPQKWDNFYNKKLIPVDFKEDENMNAGTYGHKLLDIYYRNKYKHTPLNDTIKLMQDYNPDEDTCECGCSKDLHIPLKIAPTIEECKRCGKCTKFRPYPFDLNTKDRRKVLKRLNDYIYKYQANDIMPLSESHIEIGFSEPIYEDRDNLFVLEGRVDLIGKMQGLDCFMDHKFQSKSYWLYPKTVQIKNYLLATKMPMAVINYIRLQDKVQDDTLSRDVVTMNRVELDTWHKRLVQVFFRIKKTLQVASNNGHNEMERTWSACSGQRLTYDKERPQYCWYRDLCETIDPQVALKKEQTLFKIKEQTWRPW